MTKRQAIAKVLGYRKGQVIRPVKYVIKRGASYGVHLSVLFERGAKGTVIDIDPLHETLLVFFDMKSIRVSATFVPSEVEPA